MHILGALADYHIHTPLCGHAQGAPEEYVRAAIAKGLGEIGFSDHMPMPDWYDPPHRMRREQMPEYVRSIQEVQKRFPDFQIRLGIEADYHERAVEHARKLLSEFQFDYVLGSVHFVDDWGINQSSAISGFQNRPIREIWNRYFEVWQQAIESGLFDIMAHPDLVKKYGFRPEGDLRPYYEKALQACARADVAIEINTAGLFKRAQELFPSDDFLKRAFALNIPLTISSDAHAPEEVGRAFKEGLGAARKAGYRRLVRFKDRRRSFVEI